ncbi:MAG TPA: MBOAT family protein [Candidatus Butyricicoccus avistercoris]|uniref:MBOAT family protein n=1 Tax=Candidatus Butyricicoccus avistercoris TaxID=2838518 RepID=A0A9D1TI13_9FIRM|nr:MBOAT family protein [Candidatus Butyricicoccus avistercoris]
MQRFKKPQLAKYFLFLISLWFYAANDIRSLPVLILSILVNFYLGKQILKTETHKKLLCVIGILLNLAVLGVFKYLNFFMENISFVFGQSYTPISLILPLGISFFTFQQISYLIDCKNNNADDYSISEYALFASFFPYVTSGPIAFHSEIIPQLRKEKNFKPSAYNIARGLTAFAFGLFKKVVVADTLGAAVNAGWSNISSLNASSALVVILSYTLQLYFDFAGYSDMASGIAFCFNINLPINFDSPYKARNISDFWKRWHMTMTRFFTRYLYIPLGGSRHGLKRTCLNTLIIFLVSGLWHGAAWTFIFWGFLHGIAMVISRLISAKTDRHLPYPLAWLLTFIYVNICWVFFRAPNIKSAFSLFSRLTSGFGFIVSEISQSFLTTEVKIFRLFIPIDDSLFATLACVVFLVLACLGAIFPQNMQRKIQNFKPTTKLCYLTIFVLFWSIISLSGISTFLYFNF